MSYEGYSQLLCKKGHNWNLDCNEMPQEYEEERDTLCPICGEKSIWENMVNTTNGSWDDDGIRIDGFIDLKIKKCTQGICSKCKKPHVCETIYEIPNRNDVELGVNE